MFSVQVFTFVYMKRANIYNVIFLIYLHVYNISTYVRMHIIYVYILTYIPIYTFNLSI